MKKHFVQAVLSVVFAFFLLEKAASQIAFAPFQQHSTDGFCTAVALGDFDGDGRTDAAATTFSNLGEQRIFLFRQSPTGLVLHEKKALPAGWAVGRSIQAGDLDGDGHLDLVFPCATDSVGLLFQTAGGWFGPSLALKTGANPDCVAIGDLNGDGLNDLAVSNWNDLFLTVFYQKSDHSGFERQDFPCKEGGWTEVEIADADGDGLLDVFLMQGQGLSGVFIYRQKAGGGGLAPALEIPLAGSFQQPKGIATGDLDGDSRADLAILRTANLPEAGVRLHFQAAAGGILAESALLVAYDVPEAALVADLNCDGQNELAVAHGGWHAVSVFERGSAGDFGPFSKFLLPYTSHYAPQAIAAGDLTGDGLPDLAIANYDAGLVVLENQSPGSAGNPKTETVFLFETNTETRDTARSSAAFWCEKRDTSGLLVTVRRDSFLIEKRRIEAVLRIDSVFLLQKTTCSGQSTDTLRRSELPLFASWEEADTLFLSSKIDSFLLPRPIAAWSCRLFPNPTLGALFVEFSNPADTVAEARVELFAANGKRLFEGVQPSNWPRPDLLFLPFENLPSGLYFFRWRGPDWTCELPFLRVNE